MGKVTASALDALDREWREADEELDYLGQRPSSDAEPWKRAVHKRLYERADARWLNARAAYLRACELAPLAALLTHAEHNADRLAAEEGNETTVREQRAAIAEVRRARRAVSGRAERLVEALRGAAFECGIVLFGAQLEAASRKVAGRPSRRPARRGKCRDLPRVASGREASRRGAA